MINSGTDARLLLNPALIPASGTAGFINPSGATRLFPNPYAAGSPGLIPTPSTAGLIPTPATNCTTVLFPTPGTTRGLIPAPESIGVNPEESRNTGSNRKRRRKTDTSPEQESTTVTSTNAAAAANEHEGSMITSSGTTRNTGSNEFPRWIVHETVHKRKECRRRVRISPVGSLTPERRHEALRNNRDLAGRADADYILEKEYPELSDFIIPLLGDKDLCLNNTFSIVRTEEEVDKMYSQYCEIIASKMNGKIPCFLQHRFHTAQEAKIALMMFVRSYVAGFTIHQKRREPSAKGFRYELQCHTRNNRRTNPSAETGNLEATSHPVAAFVRERCTWKAYIEEDDSSATFVRIDSFSLHKRDCPRKFSRLTTEEVTWQDQFNRECRPGVMNKLHQTVVPVKTLSQRRYRMNAATCDELDKAFSHFPERTKISLNGHFF